MNLTNPKSIVFLAALFPQFIMPQQPQLMQYIVLGVTTIVVDIIVNDRLRHPCSTDCSMD